MDTDYRKYILYLARINRFDGCLLRTDIPSKDPGQSDIHTVLKIDVNKNGCPLNNPQQDIFNDIERRKKPAPYVIPSIIRIDRKYSDDRIMNALDMIFTAHPVLTMHIEKKDGVPCLVNGTKPVVQKGTLNPANTVSFFKNLSGTYYKLNANSYYRSVKWYRNTTPFLLFFSSTYLTGSWMAELMTSFR